MKEILLFDMDNVLLIPLGYRRALQQAVSLVSTALGYRAPDFSDQVIEEIEASGVTSEWEMAAITAATLMAATPDITRKLPARLEGGEADINLADPPAILPTFQQLARLDPMRSPLDRAEQILLNGSKISDEHLIEEIRSTLRHARTAESVIFRTIQELVLGSQHYEDIYGRESTLNTDSYLDRYDRTSIEAHLSTCIQEWRQDEDHEAVIFTNRPSTPPPGHADTPEAEIGARLVGLANVPIIGSGDLGWLALQKKQRIDAFLKPSPIHALSALLLAVGAEKAQAMQAAWALAGSGSVNKSLWQALEGSHVTAFEDSAKGLRSAQRAQAALAGVGLNIELTLMGVSQHPAKRRELEAVGARVFPDVNEAIRSAGIECPA